MANVKASAAVSGVARWASDVRESVHLIESRRCARGGSRCQFAGSFSHGGLQWIWYRGSFVGRMPWCQVPCERIIHHVQRRIAGHGRRRAICSRRRRRCACAWQRPCVLHWEANGDGHRRCPLDEAPWLHTDTENDTETTCSRQIPTVLWLGGGGRGRPPYCNT